MSKLYTFGFYNVENLFDTVNQPYVNDNDFTPSSRKNWNYKRYENKLYKISRTISLIGKEETQKAPTLMGLAEIENKTVLTDLIAMPPLQDIPLRYVHFDSLDERGIDVALLYNYEEFSIEHAEPIRSPIFYDGDNPDYTRDILYVKGKLKESVIHVFVTHLPSRRIEGINKYKREEIAQLIHEKVIEIIEEEKNPFIMVMGDFNDDPKSKTLKHYLNTTKKSPSNYQLFNPLELMNSKKIGTTIYKRKWRKYDQILLSRAFVQPNRPPTIDKFKIFHPRFLQSWNPAYKSQPFRTYVGRKYLGGYSDHFPIYVILKY